MNKDKGKYFSYLRTVLLTLMCLNYDLFYLKVNGYIEVTEVGNTTNSRHDDDDCENDEDFADVYDGYGEEVK